MTSIVPSNSLREFVVQASETYHKALRHEPDAIDYLKMRGISGDSAAFFRLGVVADPLPGHEKYQGKLAVPYLSRAGAVTIRFRCMWTVTHPDSEKCVGHAKFLSLPGDIARIYNVEALHRPSDFICIAEGEPDTWTAHQAGLPTVGLPGVSTFRDYMVRLFAGYSTVYVLADSDDKGQGLEFGEKLAEKIANVRIISMPTGHDVNSFVKAEGPGALLERMEIKK